MLHRALIVVSLMLHRALIVVSLMLHRALIVVSLVFLYNQCFIYFISITQQHINIIYHLIYHYNDYHCNDYHYNNNHYNTITTITMPTIIVSIITASTMIIMFIITIIDLQQSRIIKETKSDRCYYQIMLLLSNHVLWHKLQRFIYILTS